MAELLEKDLVFRIIGCAMAVHNTLGRGLREKTYENSLAVEFKHHGIDYSKQTRFPVYYRNELVDEFIPDLVVENRVIVDTKTVETTIDDQRGTILSQDNRIEGRRHHQLQTPQVGMGTACFG